MLPLPCLRPCVWAITQLVRHYGACAVLCTATQPALDPIVRSFAPELSQEELCPMADADWEAFRRVTFRRAGRLDRDALAAQLQAHEQVLCIVNTRKSAREVFNRLEGEGNFHLSTLMYPAHRRAVLDEVRRRLREGQTCRVVSTSLIEAGVDVDFPALYREEAGLDSMLQAAGRCNREGRRAPEESVVVLFQGEGRPPRLFETAIDAGRMVLDRFADIASREAVRSYFEILRDLKGRDAQDIYGILPLMESEFFPFRTVAERFHLIDSPTVTVYIPEGEGVGLVERLRGGEGLRHGENPSFCCWMDGRVYAVAELPQGASVTAYALEGDALRPLGRMELPGRRGLCHLAAVDGVLYGSCYESGHYFALDAELSRVLWEYLPGGTPRAHWAQEAGGLLYLADLGNDRVYGFAVVCELDGMLRFFREDGTCCAALPASGTPGPNAPGGACRMGDTLFVGNRGPNTVSAFRLTPSGATFAGEWPAGNWPRHLACLGEGLLLAACSRDDAVWSYRWDGRNLTRQDVLPLHQASCVLPLP